MGIDCSLEYKNKSVWLSEERSELKMEGTCWEFGYFRNPSSLENNLYSMGIDIDMINEDCFNLCGHIAFPDWRKALAKLEEAQQLFDSKMETYPAPQDHAYTAFHLKCMLETVRYVVRKLDNGASNDDYTISWS